MKPCPAQPGFNCACVFRCLPKEAKEPEATSATASLEPVSIPASVLQIGPEEAYHNDEGKPDVTQVPYSTLVAIAGVLQQAEASGKYPKHNWRKGTKHTKFLASALRHIMRYLDGETIDPDSGKPHLDHGLANIAIVVEWISKGLGEDDRYKPDYKVV